MEDRELVELAAKAMGYDGLGIFDEREGCITDHSIFIFDPLNDDGDALRLAVKLCSTLQFTPPASGFDGFVQAWGIVGVEYVEEEYGADPAAATRRAIVRVAAEIGRRAEFSQLAETLKTEPRTD